jgi:hypothetical protein
MSALCAFATASGTGARNQKRIAWAEGEGEILIYVLPIADISQARREIKQEGSFHD